MPIHSLTQENKVCDQSAELKIEMTNQRYEKISLHQISLEVLKVYDTFEELHVQFYIL